jgi:DnaJ-class molecular chaperone
MESYYELLGANSSMSIKDIKKEYIKLMKKNHPDRSGQDDQCKKITEAYQQIARYKLNMNCDDNLMSLGFETLPMEYVRRKISNKEFKQENILKLKDGEREKKSVFEKMFDFFFDSDSDSSDDD